MAESAHTWLIRPATQADLAPFFAYLDDHLRHNSADGGPLFQPMSRGESRLPSGVRISFLKGLDIDVGSRTGAACGWPSAPPATSSAISTCAAAPRWRRATAPCSAWASTAARASLLVETAVGWAHDNAGIGWIGLEVLSENEPAVALYLRTGFTVLARVSDILRIDGSGMT
jgi:GNAT superfamily N-acetyltransferase